MMKARSRRPKSTPLAVCRFADVIMDCAGNIEPD
jgi:hypothetical protein